MTKEEHIQYWLTTAQHDMESASSMVDSKHFDWSLFVGHLALEKLLKAHWVKNNAGDIPPKIHHLVRLANEAKLSLTDEQSEFLADVNGFNIEARYPEQKLAFYKLCTKEFASEKLNKIKEYYGWLRRMI